jgi:hypothetical protein
MFMVTNGHWVIVTDEARPVIATEVRAGSGWADAVTARPAAP